MIHHPDQLFIGAPRGPSLRKTLDVIQSKLRTLCDFRGRRLLDVGCGSGTFTRLFAEHYEEVYGIDVQEKFLSMFRESVAGNNKFHILEMSASQMKFPDGFFDTIVTIETLEHVPDLSRTVAECARVLRGGGELLLTVPNRFFPFENHGIRIGNWERHGRFPLLPWIPILHDRLSLARVFTVRDLDALFLPCGFQRKAVTYAWPTFEHGGNRLQPMLQPLFPLMRLMENSPLRFLGTSVIVKYTRCG